VQPSPPPETAARQPAPVLLGAVSVAGLGRVAPAAACGARGVGGVTGDHRAALKVLALANPAGTPINLTQIREDLLELVDGAGAGPAEPAAKLDAPDQLLTVPEAAARLALPVRYLYAHANRLPFVVRVGRKVRCSELRLVRWLARRPTA
jgi:excisionase family DNA binding protein